MNPSALIDARDNKIDELAGLVAVQVVDHADGTRSISLRGGQPLVVGGRSATMSAVTNPDRLASIAGRLRVRSVCPAENRLGWRARRPGRLRNQDLDADDRIDRRHGISQAQLLIRKSYGDVRGVLEEAAQNIDGSSVADARGAYWQDFADGFADTLARADSEAISTTVRTVAGTSKRTVSSPLAAPPA